MSAEPPKYVLYPLWAIAAATAGAGVFTGAFMIALNYRRLKNAAAESQTVALGLAANFLVLIFFIYAGTPQSEFLQWFFRLLQATAIYFLAQKLQGEALKQHLEAGGAIATWGSIFGAVAVGLLILMLTAAICAVCSSLLVRK